MQLLQLLMEHWLLHKISFKAPLRLLVTKEIEWDGEKIDLSNFSTKSLSDLVLEYNPKLTEDDLTNLDNLRAFAESIKIAVKEEWREGKILLEIFEKTVEEETYSTNICYSISC